MISFRNLSKRKVCWTNVRPSAVVELNSRSPRLGNRKEHRRTGQHPFGGGQTEFCPNGFGGGGGVVAEIFRDPYSVGRRKVATVFRRTLFPLTAVTEP